MHEKLVDLGLTNTEAKIYTTLIDLGKAPAGIISRKTGIHRRSVYDALERLIKKGLVSYIKENEKRFYIPSDPQRLEDIWKQTKEELDSAMPALKAKYGEAKKKEETLFYRGIEGIKTILEDQVQTGEEVLILGAASNAPEILKYYLPHYTSKRIGKKVKLRLIYAGVKPKQEVPLAEIRHLPQEFASPVSTNIYADKVAIIIWRAEPIAILIRDAEISSAYRKYFGLLWETAEK